MIREYVIREKLGTGSYGIVYKVTKAFDPTIYVIKQISLIGLTKQQINQVQTEAKILSLIKSKYVVKYYDSFEEKNCLNIVMEYCDDGDLCKYICECRKNSIPLSEEIIWKIFIQITIGLSSIHKLKILHRDLKTLNIFLKKGMGVKIGDLGVAKELQQLKFATTVIGTPYYLSPEMCEDKPYNDKSDVWALGCILYELCTFKHPFNARSQGALIMKIIKEKQEPILKCYSKDLQFLIDSILEKNDKIRPSCKEILSMSSVVNWAKKFNFYQDIINECYEFKIYGNLNLYQNNYPEDVPKNNLNSSNEFKKMLSYDIDININNNENNNIFDNECKNVQVRRLNTEEQKRIKEKSKRAIVVIDQNILLNSPKPNVKVKSNYISIDRKNKDFSLGNNISNRSEKNNNNIIINNNLNSIDYDIHNNINENLLKNENYNNYLNVNKHDYFPSDNFKKCRVSKLTSQPYTSHISGRISQPIKSEFTIGDTKINYNNYLRPSNSSKAKDYKEIIHKNIISNTEQEIYPKDNSMKRKSNENPFKIADKQNINDENNAENEKKNVQNQITNNLVLEKQNQISINSTPKTDILNEKNNIIINYNNNIINHINNINNNNIINNKENNPFIVFPKEKNYEKFIGSIDIKENNEKEANINNIDSLLAIQQNIINTNEKITNKIFRNDKIIDKTEEIRKYEKINPTIKKTKFESNTNPIVHPIKINRSLSYKISQYQKNEIINNIKNEIGDDSQIPKDNIKKAKSSDNKENENQIDNENLINNLKQKSKEIRLRAHGNTISHEINKNLNINTKINVKNLIPKKKKIPNKNQKINNFKLTNLDISKKQKILLANVRSPEKHSCMKKNVNYLEKSVSKTEPRDSKQKAQNLQFIKLQKIIKEKNEFEKKAKKIRFSIFTLLGEPDYTNIMELYKNVNNSKIKAEDVYIEVEKFDGGRFTKLKKKKLIDLSFALISTNAQIERKIAEIKMIQL